MKKNLLLIFAVAIVLSGCSNITTVKHPKILLGSHAAVTPVPGKKSWWQPRHLKVTERIKQGNVDLLMIGDSITHGWEKKGKETWDNYYGSRNAVNLGFGSDRTEHVLWRLENGEVDGIAPKLAVLMIGTNNSNGDDYTSKEIADGIIAICQSIRAKLPTTKILMLAIFPRAQGASAQSVASGQNAAMNTQWEKNRVASRIASKFADNKWIYYLDINEKFLNDEGFLTKEVMPDLLHPGKKGYKIWAESMEPIIVKLMNE